MKVLLAQLQPVTGNKTKNIEKMERSLRKNKPDLALFGELFLTGYMARDELRELAEGIPGTSTRAVQRLAKKYSCHIVFGMPERTVGTRLLFNDSVLVSPEGVLGKYRKIHPANFGPFDEGIYFGRGREPVLVDTELGKIGLMICFDSFFPELAKIYALQGADMVAVISAAPMTSKPFFDKVLPARAVENTIFVLYCNLVGTELNMVYAGGTQAIGPRGEYKGMAKDFKEDNLVVDLDLADLQPTREARPTIRDTRKYLFETLVKPRPHSKKN